MLKRYTIVGAIFVLLIGTLNHFLYDWTGKCWLIGLFTPINESTWEHMKLLFFPMLIIAPVLYNTFKNSHPCIEPALLSGILAGTLLIPVLFYTYTGILGRNYFVLDIATFVLSVIVAFFVTYKYANKCTKKPQTNLLMFVVILFALFFGIFTYFPPNIALFLQPQ